MRYLYLKRERETEETICDMDIPYPLLRAILSDKSDPEMTPKSPEITQRGGRQNADREGYEPGRPALVRGKRG